MAFSAGSTNSVAASGDVSLSNPGNQQVLSYDGPSAKWANSAPPIGGSEQGAVYFDDFFAGSTDSQKISALNTWAAGLSGSGSMPAVLFAARQYNFSTAIQLRPGLKLIGGPMLPAREFSRSTILNWQGGSGTSLFSFVSGQNPRDITVAYMQLQGGTSTHCLPKNDPSSGSAGNRELIDCQFHGCGFKNFNTVWWGWGTGSSVSGQTHFQSIGDTALHLGGSNNRIFGRDAYSFAANSDATMTNTPFIRSRMSSSYLGLCMVTARKGSTCLSIEAGSNLVVDGMAFDAQSSDPIYGAGVIISGGENITISNCSFKGVATNPSSGWGGAANNRGWIQMSGGKQLSVIGCNFRREGNNMPATTYPLLYVGPSVPAAAAKWGFNNYSNFAGSPAVIQQASSGRISALNDPLLTISVGA